MYRLVISSCCLNQTSLAAAPSQETKPLLARRRSFTHRYIHAVVPGTAVLYSSIRYDDALSYYSLLLCDFLRYAVCSTPAVVLFFVLSYIVCHTANPASLYCCCIMHIIGILVGGIYNITCKYNNSSSTYKPGFFLSCSSCLLLARCGLSGLRCCPPDSEKRCDMI